MFWHLLLSEQREQLGRQLLCCPGRQLIAVFAKARDRRQCRGKSRRQHKRTDYRGADRALAMALRQSWLEGSPAPPLDRGRYSNAAGGMPCWTESAVEIGRASCREGA